MLRIASCVLFNVQFFCALRFNDGCSHTWHRILRGHITKSKTSFIWSLIHDLLAGFAMERSFLS